MPVARVERRLAAIMATDIVAYSRLIETDEARTLATIRALRSEVMDPLIADHRGRIVKLMGDGAIVEFGSVVDAVACAVAVQEGTAAHQREVPPESRIVFRIGINVGDVVVEDGDLLGDGVNIAARLEALAEPGGICIADAVQKQLAGKTDLAFEDAGERTLKNIAQPVRVWRWSKAPTTAAAARCAAALARQAVDRSAPFDNLSGQPEETYFSDGITEDIITGLARFRSLFVIARNSSFAFRGKSVEHGRDRPAAWRLLPSRRQCAAGRRARAHHRAADRGGDRRASLGRTLRPQSRRHLRSSGRSCADHCVRRWSGELRMQGFSNRSESRQPAWLPTTACCAAWPTFGATRRLPISKPLRCSRRRLPSMRGMPWRIPIVHS